MAWSPAGAMTADIVLQKYSHFRNQKFFISQHNEKHEIMKAS